MNAILKHIVHRGLTPGEVQKYTFQPIGSRHTFKILSWKLGHHIKVQGTKAKRPRLIKGNVQKPKILSYWEYYHLQKQPGLMSPLYDKYVISFGNGLTYYNYML